MTTPTSRRFFGGFTPFGLALLVVVLLMGTTGGAVAGALITGKQIKDGTVASIDVANSSLSGTDVRNDSLTASDIADDSRVWGVTVSEPVDVLGGAVVASKTFTSRKGFVQIEAALDGEDGVAAGVGYLVYAVVLDGDLVDSFHYLDFYGEQAGANGSISVVVPVAAASHTVELFVFEDEGDTGAVVYTRDLTVTYTAVGSPSTQVLTGRKVPARATRR